jgi:hypothetical protein
MTLNYFHGDWLMRQFRPAAFHRHAVAFDVSGCFQAPPERGTPRLLRDWQGVGPFRNRDGLIASSVR